MVDFVNVTGPAHWASYLVNGDASGLTPKEKRQCDAWCERLGIINVVSCGDEAWFTWHVQAHAPEVDYEGGDIIDYTVELKA